jgi:FtsP/CotA-like multicopper oxidase with cupredoxin domain
MRKNRHSLRPDYNKKLCQSIHMIHLNVNDVVEFVMMHDKDSNEAKNIHTLHPMHMHGHSYAIVGIGKVKLN